MRAARLALLLGLAATAAIAANVALLTIAGRNDSAGRLSPIVGQAAVASVPVSPPPSTTAPPPPPSSTTPAPPPSTTAPSPPQPTRADGDDGNDGNDEDD